MASDCGDTSPRRGAERREIRGAVSKPHPDRVARVSAGDPVAAVEGRRERRGSQRIRVGRRSDSYDPKADQRPDRDDVRGRLDDVPAELRPDRPRETARRQAERGPVDGCGLLALRDPEPSIGHLGVGEIGVASHQPRKARPVAQAGIEAVREPLSSPARNCPFAGKQDLTQPSHQRNPLLSRLLMERIAREVFGGRPIREHAHRNHVARLDAKPTRRAAVEEHLARAAGVREPSTQELRPAERHAVTAVHVHGEEDRVRPRDLDGTVETVARAVCELRGLRRGRDLRERADLRDRLLEIGVAVVGGVVAGAGPGRPESGTRRGGASAPSLCAARLQLPRSRGPRRARRTAQPRATHATASGARSGRASRRRSRQHNRRGRGVWRDRPTDHAPVLHPHLPLRCIGHLLVVRDEQDRLTSSV